MLHITNGDVAAGAIAATGTPGDIVPWRDVLHEGPVPAGLEPGELREVRARFLAAQGWGRYAEVLDDLTSRDLAVTRARDHDEVVLWFEDDLHDQLQLLQVVDSFARPPLRALTLSLVSIAGGVGRQDGAALLEAFRRREPLTDAHRSLASRAWEAFRSPDPGAVEDAIAAGPSRLFPFLHDALVRHLEEFPSSRNGLSRTEMQALDTLAGGVPTLREAFVASHHAREERVFLGDVVFALVVSRLARGVHPLVEADDGASLTPPRDGAEADRFWSRRVSVTAAGRLVLECRQDAARLNGLNRWLGGVHLHGHDPAWRWDAGARCLRVGEVGGMNFPPFDDPVETPDPVETRLRDGAGMEVVGTMRTAGRPSGVVLVPGILCWRGLEEIDAVSRALSLEHDVLAIDVRGHGDSVGRFTWGREEWRQVDAAATHLAAGGRRVTVVGFSFGGLHAAKAASEGAPIDRLALIGAPFDLRVLDHFPFGPSLWRHLPWIVRRKRRWARFEWPRVAAGKLSVSALAHIRARTLVVHGRSDWLVSRRHAEGYVRHIAGARLVEIDRGLHAEFLMRSHPERLLQLLQEFCGPMARGERLPTVPDLLP